MEHVGWHGLLTGSECGVMPGQRRVNLVALGSAPAAWDGADPLQLGKGIAGKTLTQVTPAVAQCHPGGSPGREQERGGGSTARRGNRALPRPDSVPALPLPSPAASARFSWKAKPKLKP